MAKQGGKSSQLVPLVGSDIHLREVIEPLTIAQAITRLFHVIQDVLGRCVTVRTQVSG